MPNYADTKLYPECSNLFNISLNGTLVQLLVEMSYVAHSSPQRGMLTIKAYMFQYHLLSTVQLTNPMSIERFYAAMRSSDKKFQEYVIGSLMLYKK